MKGEILIMSDDSYVYYCRNCGKVFFGPQDMTDEERQCLNCGEVTDLTDLTEEKWNSMREKSREWQINLWRNQTEFDASITEQYDEDSEGDGSYYSPVYVESGETVEAEEPEEQEEPEEPEEPEDDMLSDYYSVVWDWETNHPEEDGEYIIWFIRKDKDPSSRKLSFDGESWLDAKGEEINLGKYHPAMWMKLPTFSEEVIEYYRNR